MMRVERPLVLFDIGAVLLRLTYDRFFAAVEQDHASVPEFRRAYAQLELRDMLGQASNREFLTETKNLLGEPDLSDDDVTSLVSRCWGEQIDEMISLKSALAQSDHAVGLLSNMGRFGFSILSRTHPAIFETFDPHAPRVYSFEHGVIKPESGIYKLISSIYSPVIFIDDKEPYLTAAEPFGWKGIHYTPHIDTAEAVRQFNGHETRDTSSPNVRVCHDRAQVVDALRGFGIEI